MESYLHLAYDSGSDIVPLVVRIDGPHSTFYLTHAPGRQELGVSRDGNVDHAHLRLDVSGSDCLLSVHHKGCDPVIVEGDRIQHLTNNGPGEENCIFISEDDEIIYNGITWWIEDIEGTDCTPSQGIPSEEWKYEPFGFQQNLEAALSNDTGLQLELFLRSNTGALADQYTIDDLEDGDEGFSIPVTEIILSPAEADFLVDESGVEPDKMISQSVVADTTSKIPRETSPQPQGRYRSTAADRVDEANEQQDPAERLHARTVVTAETVASLREKQGDLDFNNGSRPGIEDRDQVRKRKRAIGKDATCQTHHKRLRADPNRDNEPRFSNTMMEQAADMPGRPLLDVRHDMTSRPLPNVQIDLEQSDRKSNRTTSGRRENLRTQSALDAGEAVDNPPRRSSRLSLNSQLPSLHTHTVAFSTTCAIQSNRRVMSTFKRLGGIAVDDITAANMLCLGSNRLKHTPKFLIAIATGKAIVTDDWLKQAHINQKFPDWRHYMPKDKKREKEWGFSLSEALLRGRQGLRLLRRMSVYITTFLRKELGDSFKEFKHIGRVLGAESVRTGIPHNFDNAKVLVIGSTSADDVECQRSVLGGQRVFQPGILTKTVLQGQLELESDEFLIHGPA